MKVISVCLMVVLIVLTGCASSLVLGKVYDSFGSQSAKRFKSYAAFNASQEQQIDSFAASYHSWHRQTQLKRYAEFLTAMLADVESVDEFSIDKSEKWWQTVRGFSDDMRACNPFNVVADLLSGLTDMQVNQISSKLRKELNEREDEYRAETPEARVEKRVKEMTKWAKRAGAGFNDAQTDLLRTTMQSQISLGAQRYELRRLWMEEFILLLSNRAQQDFKLKITRHIDSNWRITENAFPQQWKYNEQLWTAYIKDFINLQTSEQRRVFTNKVSATANTLKKLSEKNLKHAPVCHGG